MPSAKIVPADNSSVTSVAASASSQTLVDARAGRMGLAIYNDSTATLYLKLSGNAASTTSHTVQVMPDGYYESPAVGYSGEVTGIWSSATGSARITELF